jgi:hypothetical protein
VVAASAGHRARASRLLSCGAIVFGLVDLAIFLPTAALPSGRMLAITFYFAHAGSVTVRLPVRR